jgi:flagellar export protein FliJ
VKQKLLEQKHRELEDASAAVKRIINEIEALRQETSKSYDYMSTGRCFTGKELSALVGYIAFLDTKIADLNIEKQRREDRVSSVRVQLYDLGIELKMLQKLESKTLQIIRKAHNKKEQKLMDELALRVEGQ